MSNLVRISFGWMTPYEQILYLREKKDFKAWERFRDSLMRRWSNLNVINGLIMGAVSTIVFSDFPLSTSSFTLGIISLLTSLIAIGFGVGLTYVLGDVRGTSLNLIDEQYPKLYLFALSIPEVWGIISFASFFGGLCVIVWQATDKGWVVKAGVVAAVVALFVHLAAFAFLFREQDTAAYLIPDHEVFVPADSNGSSEERPMVESPKADQFAETDKGKRRAGSSGSVHRPGMSMPPLRSSQTLVNDSSTT